MFIPPQNLRMWLGNEIVSVQRADCFRCFKSEYRSTWLHVRRVDRSAQLLSKGADDGKPQTGSAQFP